jgi:uncharacterized protein (DUF1800 family)
MPVNITSSNLGLTPYKGEWTKPIVKHLLKRTLFGVKASEIDYFLLQGLTNSVDILLADTADYPSPPLNDYNTATVIDPVAPLGQTWVNNPSNDGTINSLRRRTLKKWWVGVMLNQDRTIREKLTLFWANHFSTESDVINNANYVYWHHDLLRKNCLGNFKKLIKDVTIDAGMLRYLNGYLNTSNAPDENYARELQELFTLGKGKDVNYSEEDVKTAAKVLSGWRINNSFSVYFDATRHAVTNKQFSAYYNNKIIIGKGGANGALETDELIDMIFEKQEVAKFICRKLYTWFVYYHIDATVEKNIIEPLAVLFIQHNFEIKPVLKVLLESEHFYDNLYIGCQIKSPVDHIVGFLRETSIVFPDPITDTTDTYFHYNNIVTQLINAGQDIGDPPNVSGWPAYYQVPNFSELWINADTLPKRNKFTDLMIETGYTRNGKKIMLNTIQFVKDICINPGDPNVLTNSLFSHLLSTDVSSVAKTNLKKQILLSGQDSDRYWSDAWDGYIASPTTNNFNLVNIRLKAMIKYIMNLPEYQLA